MSSNLVINNTPAQVITIELGHSTIEVRDVSKPVWFGAYQGGKLGIYEAIVVGAHVPGSVTYVCAYVDHGAKDFITYSSYESNTPVAAIIDHLIANVFNAFQAAAGESDGTFFVDPVGYGSAETPTIH